VIEEAQKALNENFSPVAKQGADLLHSATLSLFKKNAKTVDDLNPDQRKQYAAAVQYEEEGMMDILESDASGKFDASKASDVMIEKVSKILASGAVQFSAPYQGPKAGQEDAALAKYLQMHAQGGSEVSVNATGNESYLGSSEVEAKDMTARAQARIEQAVPGVKLIGNALEAGDRLGMSTTGDRIFTGDDGKQYRVASPDGKKTIVEAKNRDKWEPVTETAAKVPDLGATIAEASEAQTVKSIKSTWNATEMAAKEKAFSDVAQGTSLSGKQIKAAFAAWDGKEKIQDFLRKYKP
jgi:hypothetical protein